MSMTAYRPTVGDRRDLMRPVLTLSADTPVYEAPRVMRDTRNHLVVVTDAGLRRACFTLTDVLHWPLPTTSPHPIDPDPPLRDGMHRVANPAPLDSSKESSHTVEVLRRHSPLHSCDIQLGSGSH